MAKPYPPTYDQYTRPEAEGIKEFGPSRTKLEFAEEADINRLMARYEQTGQLPTDLVGDYGDFSQAPDFQEAQEIIARAKSQFAGLPGRVRDRFDNDPAKFLEFVHTPGHEAELVDLGLITAKTPPIMPPAVPVAPGPVQGPSNPVPAKETPPS